MKIVVGSQQPGKMTGFYAFLCNLTLLTYFVFSCSVMAVAECTYSTGQEITMTLMKRGKDSVFAMPKVKWSERTSMPQLSSGK